MTDLSTMQTVKQGTRQFIAVASDKWGIASASVSRGETHVRFPHLLTDDVSGCL